MFLLTKRKYQGFFTPFFMCQWCRSFLLRTHTAHESSFHCRPPSVNSTCFWYSSTYPCTYGHLFELISTCNVWTLAINWGCWDIVNPWSRIWPSMRPLMNFSIVCQCNEVFAIATNINHLKIDTGQISAKISKLQCIYRGCKWTKYLPSN